MSPDYDLINRRRARRHGEAVSRRISEVARMANDLQKEGVPRSQALRIAERLVPV